MSRIYNNKTSAGWLVELQLRCSCYSMVLFDRRYLWYDYLDVL